MRKPHVAGSCAVPTKVCPASRRAQIFKLTHYPALGVVASHNQFSVGDWTFSTMSTRLAVRSLSSRNPRNSLSASEIVGSSAHGEPAGRDSGTNVAGSNVTSTEYDPSRPVSSRTGL